MTTFRSHALGYKAAQTLYYAIGEQAERIGFPFTHSVTLNFSETAVDPWDAIGVFSKLRLRRFAPWLRRPRKFAGPAVPPTYAFVFENSKDKKPFLTMNPGDPHNVHVHWLVHIPTERAHDFGHRLYEWLEELGDGWVSSTAIHVRPVFNIPALGLRPYALKGTGEAWAEHFGAKAEPQGLIVGGRRSGTSENLGNRARVTEDKRRGIFRRLPPGARNKSAA